MIQHLIILRSSFWLIVSNKKCFRNIKDWRPQGKQFDIDHKIYFLKIQWTHLLSIIIHVELTTVPSLVIGLLDPHFDLDPTKFDTYMYYKYQAKGWLDILLENTYSTYRLTDQPTDGKQYAYS